MSESFLTGVFKLLQQNKELPYYQAERRIDIFINFYLEEILNHFLGSKTISFVTPEFPLKKKENAASTKVDYLCYDDLKKVIYFVELKTDNSSFKQSQVDIYRENMNWGSCIEGLNVILKKNERTKHKEKFDLLKKRLDDNGLFAPQSSTNKMQIIYILPTISNKEKMINKDLIFITYNDLKNFKPNIHSVEWDLFYHQIINPILN